MSINLEGKIVVLTGATSGIGFETALEFIRQGIFVIATGRSIEKCREAEERVRQIVPEAKFSFLAADLSSLAEIIKLSEAIIKTIHAEGRNSIDVLIHNAGTFTSWYISTPEGFETQFAVNHLAPFMLTHHLMPLLAAAPEARVITMSSGSHYHTRINWEDILLRKHYHCLAAYKQSKLCNVLFSRELKRRTQHMNLSVFAADPGLVNTEMGLKNTSGIAKWVWAIRKRGGVPPREAARSIVWLAGEPSISHSDQLYWKYCRPQKPSQYSEKSGEALKLWLLSEKMCGIHSIDFGI